MHCRSTRSRKIREIHGALKSTAASSDAFHQLQRQYFLTAEKYLDQGLGFAPFNDGECCDLLMALIERIVVDGWNVGEAVIMPNHIHLLIKEGECPLPLQQLLKFFKGRSARRLNLQLNREGRFWQEDWFDRWMRNEGELIKTIRYIRENPVKAKLVGDWTDYPWRISRLTTHRES